MAEALEATLGRETMEFDALLFIPWLKLKGKKYARNSPERAKYPSVGCNPTIVKD